MSWTPRGGVFLVSGKTFQNSFGMRWNTKGLPSVSKTDHPKGGFAASVMGANKNVISQFGLLNLAFIFAQMTK